MGINSTEVSYGFGQLGSGHTQGTGALTPPTGKVIVAIQFLDDISMGTLVPEQLNDADAYFGTSATAHAANGSEVIDSSVVFPGGSTIFGRWTSVTMSATNASGIICYFGQ